MVVFLLLYPVSTPKLPRLIFTFICLSFHLVSCRFVSALTFSRRPDATVYVGGLDEKVSEPLLWELFLQAGPVVNTHMPKDRVTGQHQGEFVARGVIYVRRGQTAL